MIKQEDSIRKCPFCGNPKPRLIMIRGRDGFRNRYGVLCDYNEGGCGAQGGLRHYKFEAIEVWNQRKRRWIYDE